MYLINSIYMIGRACSGVKYQTNKILFYRNFFSFGKNYPRVEFCQCVICYQTSHRFESTKKSESGAIDSFVLRSVGKSSSTELKIKKISKAMKVYLERAQKHNEFLKSKEEEFEIGKQHLANIMGLDVNALTQEDVDKAIQYLLPSGLYEPKARPVMRSPRELYPKVKAAQFDISGRPFSPFFYTAKANYHQVLHDAVGKFHELDALEDKMLRKGIEKPPNEYILNLSGSEWISIDAARGKLLEIITEEDYDFLITTLTRLANHPYSFRCKDFIWKFRNDFPDVSNIEDVPELTYDENSRPYVQMVGTARSAVAHVTVWGNGSGKVKINDRGINYFYRLQDRESIMFPLELSGMIGKVDFEAKVENSGTTAQSNAVRYGLAMCLRSFVSAEVRERMRLAGLLTKDVRRRERKKPGQKGARAKRTWKKR